MVADCARHAHSTGFRQCFDAGGNVHPVSVNVVVRDDYVPEVDPDPQLDPLVVRDRSVAFGHAPLDRDRGGDRLNDTRELDQKAIAGRFHNPALMLGDLRIDEFVSMASEPRESAGLILPHEAAISGDISGENGRQSTLDPLSAHLPSRPG
jgi:hypothetical protein